jgi:ElaB/YqjD/DUF883 family membrane-anchored ribosome-binding protein
MVSNQAKSKTLVASTKLDKLDTKIMADIDLLKDFNENVLSVLAEESINDEDKKNSIANDIEKAYDQIEELSTKIDEMLQLLQSIIENIQDAIEDEESKSEYQ